MDVFFNFHWQTASSGPHPQTGTPHNKIQCLLRIPAATQGPGGCTEWCLAKLVLKRWQTGCWLFPGSVVSGTVGLSPAAPSESPTFSTLRARGCCPRAPGFWQKAACHWQKPRVGSAGHTWNCWRRPILQGIHASKLMPMFIYGTLFSPLTKQFFFSLGVIILCTRNDWTVTSFISVNTQWKLGLFAFD